ncbi:MAG TPA: DNA recombination protein RmuC [Candidatus Doudnabacteria bacterium]|nr:DNA recombination protein RmuC [Candidatus Doudnabacteria bacterium]
MENILFVLIGALFLGFIVLLYFVIQVKKQTSGGQNNDQGLQLLLAQLNELSRTVDQKLGDSAKEMTTAMRTQFSESAKLIKDVTEGLTKLDDTNKQVISFADQLQNLQDILKNPKQRGVLGEYYLETLLKNVLPPKQYQMQYAFSNKEIVDAVVFVKDKIIPIDSKFSLENYNRMSETNDPTEKLRLEKLFVNDLKLRITETSKYIRPEEGTMEFAFMFIPHEAIYYDLLINKVGAALEDSENLIQRAAGKYKVIIVSPTSFLAYLQTVLQGLKAMQIEESAKQIRVNVENLQKHLKSYEDYHTKMGSTLGTVVNHYNASSKELTKVDKDIMRITGDKILEELPQLDKPDLTQD